MEETKEKLKVYCETSFWSHLNGGHMANPVTLPKTAPIVCKAGYQCPVIVTPQEFLDRKEEFGYGN